MKLVLQYNFDSEPNPNTRQRSLREHSSPLSVVQKYNYNSNQLSSHPNLYLVLLAIYRCNTLLLSGGLIFILLKQHSFYYNKLQCRYFILFTSNLLIVLCLACRPLSNTKMYLDIGSVSVLRILLVTHRRIFR